MRLGSRILKISHSLIEAGIVTEIVLVGKTDNKQDENETLDASRRIWRVPMKCYPRLHWKVSKVIRYLQWLWKIFREFRKQDVGMVNCHSFFDLPVGVALKIKTGCKLIYDTHELETERNGLKGKLKIVFKLVEKFCMKYVDYVFTVGDSIATWYKRTYNMDNVSVVKNIPEKKNGIKRTNKFRERFNVPQDRILYLYHGAFLPGRGIPLLLSVFSKENIQDHIVFMGYGLLEDEIKSYSTRKKNIHFHEAVHRDQLSEYTSSADAGFSLIEHTSLSYYYSMPNKIYEYLMSGVPSIVSNFPEMSAFINDYKCGWTVEVDEKSVFAKVKGMSREKLKEKRLDVLESIKRDDLGWNVEKQKLIKVYKELYSQENQKKEIDNG
ncbi:MAG: glycosyltransferase family 4 protein [bacterium]|nr:glycosyltransferase family 4 protein [bacterium]